MKINLDDVRGDVFSTSSRHVGPRMLVDLVGCLDMQTAPFLQRFLNHLLPHAESGAFDEVQFNTEQLYLLSSSAISCLASWLKSLRALKQVCRVTFVTNANLGWQRRSLDPLRRLAEQVVQIQ